MRLSIAFARSTFIAIPNERQVKSLIDDLVTKRGVVSGRLALLRGSTETQPLLLDLKNKSPPPRKRSRVVPRVRPTPSRPPDSPASARLPRVRPTPPRPPDSPSSARLPLVRPTPPRPQRRGNTHGSPPGPRSSSSARGGAPSLPRGRRGGGKKGRREEGQEGRIISFLTFLQNRATLQPIEMVRICY